LVAIYITGILVCLILSGIGLTILEHFQNESKKEKERNTKSTSGGSTSAMYGSSGYASTTSQNQQGGITPAPKIWPYKHIDITEFTGIIDGKIKYKIKIAEKLISLLDDMLDYKKIKNKIKKTQISGHDGISYIVRALTADVLYDILKNKDVEFVTDYLNVLTGVGHIETDGTLPNKKQLKEFNILHKKYSG
jgi:hypothetical protein